jgi:hypothetical protein
MENKFFPSQKRHNSQCRPVCKIVVGVAGAGFQKVLVRRQKMLDRCVQNHQFVRIFKDVSSHRTLKIITVSVFCTVVKRPGSEAGVLPPSSAKIWTECSCNAAPLGVCLENCTSNLELLELIIQFAIETSRHTVYNLYSYL